jgi:hypothetical protein
LANLIVEVFNDRGVHTRDEVLAVAKQRNYPFGEKKPWKVVHFALVGMTKNGELERADEGYRKKLLLKD